MEPEPPDEADGDGDGDGDGDAMELALMGTKTLPADGNALRRTGHARMSDGQMRQGGRTSSTCKAGVDQRQAGKKQGWRIPKGTKC